MESVPPVAYFGYALSGSGFGTAARAYISAMQAVSVPVRVTCVDGTPHHLVHESLQRGYRRPEDPRAIPLWHVDISQLGRLRGLFPSAIAMSVWETDRLPARHVAGLNRVGEVWVPSAFNERVYSSQIDTPVFRLPHPVRPRFTPSPAERAALDQALGLPAGSFLVLSVGTWQERKNLPAVVEAFARAFHSQPQAHLMLKTSLSFVPLALARAQVVDALRRAAPPDLDALLRRVHIHVMPLPLAHMDALFARADCYLALHRGEGWCYPLFDAACIGVPVVATTGSGPADYLDPAVHRLVHTREVPVPADFAGPHFAFDATMRWLDPDVHHAAAQLRAVYENYAAARHSAAAAAVLLRDRYSLQRIGQRAAQRLADFAELQSAGSILHRLESRTEPRTEPRPVPATPAIAGLRA